MAQFLIIGLIAVLTHFAEATFGCGCGLPPPPPPCPLPIPCPPPLPPPPPCPPTFCPPPPICPTPTTTTSSTILSTSTSSTTMWRLSTSSHLLSTSSIAYQPAVPSYNDCCCQCASPCRYRSMRARTHGARIFSALSVDLDEDPQCNSEKLRNVIEENITKDPTISKRAIQKAAEDILGGRINVICAKSDFSYVAYTEKYCQASSGEVTCYAFQAQ